MPLTVSLETESKSTVLGEVVDLTNAIVRLANEDHADNPLEILHFVNPYGDTVFNELQMPVVIRDLGRLRDRARSGEERDTVDAIERLATESLRHHHLYLWFYGD